MVRVACACGASVTAKPVSSVMAKPRARRARGTQASEGRQVSGFPSTCRPSGPAWSGREDDLLAVVLLVLEDLVALRRIVQRHPVGDDPGRVDLLVLDPLEQGLHVPVHVALPGPERERSINECADGDLANDPAVGAHERDRPATATTQD